MRGARRGRQTPRRRPSRRGYKYFILAITIESGIFAACQTILFKLRHFGVCVVESNTFLYQIS